MSAPKNPEYGEELDYGGGVTVTRPTDDPVSTKPVELTEEDFMDSPAPKSDR